MNKAEIIRMATEKLLGGSKSEAVKVINQNYKFESLIEQTRKSNDKIKMKVFIRDRFIDRYSGDYLVVPGMLKVLSVYFPDEFPYQAHWKMSETHISYWELVPTIDHVEPISLNGIDEESNMVTTSMLHNSVKSNWTLQQIGWKLNEINIDEPWDGLCNLFIDVVEMDEELLKDQYVKKWYKLAKDFNKLK